MNNSSWRYLKLFAIALLGSAVLYVLNYVSKKKEFGGTVLSLVQGAYADAPAEGGLGRGLGGGGGESGCDSGCEAGGEGGGGECS